MLKSKHQKDINNVLISIKNAIDSNDETSDALELTDEVCPDSDVNNYHYAEETSFSFEKPQHKRLLSESTTQGIKNSIKNLISADAKKISSKLSPQIAEHVKAVAEKYIEEYIHDFVVKTVRHEIKKLIVEAKHRN